MQPPGPSTTGVNAGRLARARGWSAYNFAPTLPRPPAPSPEVEEVDPTSLRRLAAAARAAPREEVEAERKARRQVLSEPITLALGHIITAAGSVQASSAEQSGPALVTHVTLTSDIEASGAVLTNGAFLFATPDIPPAGSISTIFPNILPLWDLTNTIDRNSIAPGPAGGSLWWGPRILVPWSTFRITLQLQINAAITRQATAVVTYQRVGAEYREPDLDLLIMRQRRPRAPAPPDVHGMTRALPSSVLVKGPGYQRQVSLEALDPALKVGFLEAWSQNKPYPGIIPL